MSKLTVVTKETLADTDTAVSAYLKLCLNRPGSVLLESAETHDSVGRYSIIAFDPIIRMELRADGVTVQNGGPPEPSSTSRFFDLIRETVEAYAVTPPGGLPAVGSLMGYIGYDAVRLIEELGPIPSYDLPVARLILPSRFLVFDHRRRTMILAGLAEDEKTAKAKIADTEQMLKTNLPNHPKATGLTVDEPPRDHYQDAVSKAKEYIKDGEIFQVVLADKFEGRTDVEPFDLYRLLRVKSPSPYMFYLNFGDCRMVGASPETLVKVRNNQVLLRPIAGTRGRSEDPMQDRMLEKELMASDKERAEHIMLVDLGRNDAGRVSQYGTVNVNPYMTVERYSHVMHIVSQVQGELRPDADQVDAFMAGFPAGTVSGAPKVRAMQIIDELERMPRGPYSGAVGYFGPNNQMDTCIAIRMLMFEGDCFTIPVGAGIVADSSPEMEFKEIQMKAAQSLAALTAASRGEL
jgi:anthranilate synthase component 1